MDLKKVVEIVDKHVDQEALAKDLVGQLVAPELEKLAAKMESGEIDLGFRLARSCWGKGFATEAARGWVRTAFGDFTLARLTAFTHPENHASLRVLEKLGFRHERAGIVMGMWSFVFSLAAPGAEGLVQAGPG